MNGGLGKRNEQEKWSCCECSFVNKYKDFSNGLLAQNENDIDRIFFIKVDDIVWCRGRDGRRTIFGQCKDPNIEEDKITPFLAETLTYNTVHTEQIRVQRPEIGSSDWEVYDPVVNNVCY